MSIQSCTFFFLASSVSYVQAQIIYNDDPTSTGRIVAGCIVGGLFILLFLCLCLVVLSGRRRRSRMVVERPTNQHEIKPFSWGRSYPIQQNSTTPYGLQGQAQTSAPPVRIDPASSSTHHYSQGVPPPPAYVKDPNANGGYSAQSDGNGQGQNTNDIPYNPPPFPPPAHVSGQEHTFVGGFRT